MEKGPRPPPSCWPNEWPPLLRIAGPCAAAQRPWLEKAAVAHLFAMRHGSGLLHGAVASRGCCWDDSEQKTTFEQAGTIVQSSSSFTRQCRHRVGQGPLKNCRPRQRQPMPFFNQKHGSSSVKHYPAATHARRQRCMYVRRRCRCSHRPTSRQARAILHAQTWAKPNLQDEHY